MHYRHLLAAIAAVHTQSLGRAAAAVNRALVLRNWLVGAQVVEFEQGGADRARYGENLLSRLAADLAKRRIGGLGVSVLERCRRFYELTPQLAEAIPYTLSTESRGTDARRAAIPYTVSTESAGRGVGAAAPTPLAAAQVLRLSWSHWMEIIRLDDPWKRAFYENECLLGGWSVRQLQRQIGSLLYERTGLARNKRAAVARARRSAGPAPVGFEDLIRDPYVLEFAGLAGRPEYSENDLETALLDHVQAFLLELGSGFCFEARQFRIPVGDENDRIDLVFYHRRLRCHVLLDLKIRAFSHADAGQMNFYLNYLRRHLMAAGDLPPVGVVLCSEKDETKVEYATAGLSRRLFVSRYLVALPSAEHLRQFVETDRARLERTARPVTRAGRGPSQRAAPSFARQRG